MQQKGAIQIIEWEDLDKRKFYSLGVFMTLTTRITVYPASLIRTRLQVQKGKVLYSGTFDAFCKILRAEGVQGLYRGFMVNTFTLVSGQAYITTYELVRKYVSQYSPSNTVKSVVAGGAASLVAQTITVPIDVVSQQLMMQGQGEHLTRFKPKPKMVLAASKRRLTFGQTRDITVQIFAADGFRGFYRGYVASLLTYIPNSALWWPFYHFYAEQLSLLAPSECPHLILQALAGPMAAATASTITNPMDVVRARVQVNTGCVPVQGLHASEDAFQGRLHHNTVRRLSQFKGSFKCGLQMRPSFPSFPRMHRNYPSRPPISRDPLRAAVQRQETYNNGDTKRLR